MTWTKEMPANPVVAVAGATGAVGQEFLRVLHDVEAQWHALCSGVNALLRAGEDADAPGADMREQGKDVKDAER